MKGQGRIKQNEQETGEIRTLKMFTITIEIILCYAYLITYLHGCVYTYRYMYKYKMINDRLIDRFNNR